MSHSSVARKTCTQLLLAVAVACLLPSVTPTATYFKVENSDRRFYCLPQGYEKLVDQGFNSEQEAPRNATLIELTHTCDDAESFFGTLNPVSQTLAEEVIDHIAILVMSDCPFLTFLDVARDISSRVATAESLGASGVIFVSSNPGMPVPFVPVTLRIPTCMMNMANGDALLNELNQASKSVNVIIEPKNMPLHTGDDESSASVSSIIVDGVFTLEPPLPAWPALFMDLDSLLKQQITGTPVLARMSSACTVKDEGTGEYQQCQKCWEMHAEDPSLVFENSTDFPESIVLFHFQTQAEERSQRCYQEYHQLALLAQELGAAGVLFGMDSDTKRPQFPGPGQIPGLFKIPAFSILRPHAIALAAADGVPGVAVTFPPFDNELGFPPFLASAGVALHSTSVVLEVEKSDGGIGEIECGAGQSLFNPVSWKAISSEAVIARPSGICTYQDGSGCYLGPISSGKASGKILVMFLIDFLFFHEWNQHAQVAADVGATALVLVNVNSNIFTFLSSSPKLSTIPMFNVDAACGDQMVSAAQNAEKSKSGTMPPANTDGLSINMQLPSGKDGEAKESGERPLLEPLSLIEEEFVEVRQELPLAQMTFEATKATGESDRGVIDMGQTFFNPLYHRGVSGKVVAANPVAECRKENTDASLSCEACDSSSPKFEAISGSQSFVGATVLVRDTFIPCVHPADMALDFEARGAEAVVISNDGEFFRTLPEKSFARDATRPNIPTFNIMNVVGDKFFSWMEDGWILSLSLPVIRQGAATVCSSGNCDNTNANFASFNRPTRLVTPNSQLKETGGSSSKKSHTGAKVAIAVIGAIVGCAVLALLAFFVIRKSRKHKRYEVFEPGTQLPVRNKPAADVPL